MQKSENFGGLTALWPLRGTVRDMRFTYIRYLSGLGFPVRGRRRSSQGREHEGLNPHYVRTR